MTYAADADHSLHVDMVRGRYGALLTYVCKLRLIGDPCRFPPGTFPRQLPPEHKHLSTEGFRVLDNPHSPHSKLGA